MEKRLARSQRETADAAAQAEAARGDCDDLRSRLAEAEAARDRATEVLPQLAITTLDGNTQALHRGGTVLGRVMQAW